MCVCGVWPRGISGGAEGEEGPGDTGTTTGLGSGALSSCWGVGHYCVMKRKGSFYTRRRRLPQRVHADGHDGLGEAVLWLSLDEGEAGLLEDFAELVVGSMREVSTAMPRNIGG